MGALTACSPSKATVTIDGTTISAARATTVEQQEAGLKGRVDLQLNEGMLFELAEPQDTSVWGHGMLIPLDVVWILNHEVVRVDALNPCDWDTPEQCEKIPSPGKVDAILEVHRDVFSHVEPGTSVSY
ncbi:DUF192 domain-containing protein [Leucobacter sp. UCMA 4100]|uniref:DUF192 domain-containing protein n=1 Tax=Leucobacter sp. UCMA 4100 TaxID=2810534 RepID=UPI0022EACD32|nr:DUF192 domain-containing protein [Leucobacter sp. UCMA 4100]MDA3145786.1 DUF192 domain-containing protein [Leucobacter sp. UCMA 4100]